MPAGVSEVKGRPLKSLSKPLVFISSSVILIMARHNLQGHREHVLLRKKSRFIDLSKIKKRRHSQSIAKILKTPPHLSIIFFF